MIAFDDLKELAGARGPCLSIFQPLRDEFSQVTKADTRLHAAARQADEMLAKKIFDSTAREEFLSPIFKLAENTDWSGRTGSMVIFRAPDYTKASFWPDTLDMQIHLGEEFFILPLVEGLSAKRDYWVLALNMKHIRLFRGTPDSFAEVELPKGLPRSIEEFGGFDQPDHDLESRSSPGAAGGQTAPVRSGTGTSNEALGRYLHDFFRKIDRTIQPILGNCGDPLILAAVEREIAIYREVNTYSRLLDQAIHGSPDPMGENRLHKAALELTAADSARAPHEAHKEIDRAAGRGLLVTDLDEIEKAARLAQIERLFVNPKPASSENRINHAAVAVIRNSGDVAVSDSLDTGIAAILRYRVPEAPQPELAESRI